ncbi:TetR/AcrR family transcriptional regulator [Sphingobium sp. BYY-5]|nr:TetR/AcrR family transcriptional regulator [Sphingobium sp. BYY-5]
MALLVEEGYAAVSGRKVASRAGLNPSLVHYYFPTTDDLLVTAYQRGAEQSLERHKEAALADDPWAALWALSIDPSRTALAMEFMALANHRKAIRGEIARYADEIRAVQSVALKRAMEKAGIDLGPCTPATASVLLAGIARVLVMEEGVGIVAGHDETYQFMEWLFARLKDRPGDGMGGGTP